MTSMQSAKTAYDRIQALLGDDYNESLSAIRYEPEDTSRVNASWVDGDSSILVVSEQQQQPFAHDSNELHFHILLDEFLASYGLQAVDNLSIASDFARQFAEKCNQSYGDLHRAHSRNGNQRLAAESRAERDLWSLLQLLSGAQVLGEAHPEDCEIALERATGDLAPIITAPEYINTAMENDFRIKKGFIIKDWLERCSKDLVRVITPPKMPPCADTLFALLHETNTVYNKQQQLPFNSIHPDAQISSNAGLHVLLGDDSLDQERLLTCIWQLLRSGQMADAQKLAFDHQAHWFAAALRGMDPHFYEVTVENEDAVMPEEEDAQQLTTSVQRKGNLKQSLWIRTAWRYTEHLSKALTRGQVTKASEHITELEMNIFALLSHHLKIQCESSSSSLLSSWHDRVWVYISAIHNRDIMQCMLRYYEMKAGHSGLYPALDDQSTLLILDELLRSWDSQLQGLSISNLDEMFHKVKFVSPSPSRNLESILYQLQAAVLAGPNSLGVYLDENLFDLMSSSEGEVMRIITHLLIWCHALPDEHGHEMKDIITEETYFKVLELYIDHLIKTRHFVLVAGYARLLSRHRRINAYAELLLTLQRLQHENWEEGVEARQAMQLAQQFFPDDIIEITRRVVNRSTSSTSSSDIIEGIEEEKKNGYHFAKSQQQQQKNSAVQSLDKSILSPFLTTSTADNKKKKKAATKSQFTLQQQGLSDSDRMALESIGWAVMDDGAAALRSVHRVLIGRILSLGQENIREKMEVLPLMMHHAHLLEDVFLDRLEHARELHILAHPPSSQQPQMQAQSKLAEKQWNADKNLFHMWRMLVGLQDPWSSWKQVVGDYERDQARTVYAEANKGIFMRYGQGMYRLAVDGVLPFVQELFLGLTTPDTNGVTAYCHAAMSVAREMIMHRLSNALLAIDSHQDEAMIMSAMSTTAALVSDVDNGSRFEEITQLLRQIPTLLAQTEAKYAVQFVPSALSAESILRSCEELQHGVLHRMLSTPQIVMLHENLSLMVQALQDFRETWQLLRGVSTYLLQVYLLTATQTATVLQQVGLADEEKEMWSLAMKLGDLIASEDPKLLLYRTIDREVLEQLVQGLAEAARQLLPNGASNEEVSTTAEDEELEEQEGEGQENNNEIRS